MDKKFCSPRSLQKRQSPEQNVTFHDLGDQGEGQDELKGEHHNFSTQTKAFDHLFRSIASLSVEASPLTKTFTQTEAGV